MCLIALAWHSDPRYPLALAANRDEFYRRPTLPADWWPDAPGVLAGRDEEQGGSWLGLHVSGRFAAVTNARGAASAGRNPPSRGQLVREFLSGNQGASEYAHQCHEQIASYAGCNLLLGDGRQLFYVTNHPAPELRELPAGYYSLSNGHIDDHWPKMRRLAAGMTQALAAETVQTDDLLMLLTDRHQAEADELPHTGIGKRLEKQLSSVFIQMPVYGTRCSTGILAGTNGRLSFHERRFDARGQRAGDSRFTLEWPQPGK